jgi:dTMP kinase
MLIVVEGIDGAGKTTLVDGIRTLLLEEGHMVRQWAFPSKGTVGQLARRLFSEDDGVSLLLLLLADMVHEMAQRSDEEEAIDLVDRFTLSTRVYQRDVTYSSDQLLDAVMPLIERVLPDVDLWVLLTLRPATAAARIAARPTASDIDDPDVDALSRYRNRYHHAIVEVLMNSDASLLVLDAEQPTNVLVSRVVDRIYQLKAQRAGALLFRRRSR